MDDSWLILVSFAGFVMAPFWAIWSNAALRKFGLSRLHLVMGVLMLSLATLLVTFVGPWVLMMILHGTLADNLSEPRFPIGMLLFFGPGIALQVYWALNVALRTGNPS